MDIQPKTVHPFEIYALSEKAVTVQFGNSIDEENLNKVAGLNRVLKEQPFPGMIATVPAYASLSIFYDPLLVLESRLNGINSFEKVSSYLYKVSENNFHPSDTSSDSIIIPVCYEIEFGPDLQHVARYNKLSPEEVIALHSSAHYKVYMIGFIPGFAYLGGMPHALVTPRRATPRKNVPAGSVGIAGSQTGIYPLKSPGGWQLIGQTPLKLFDVNRTSPSLLKTGDLIQFKIISRSEFKDVVA